MSKQEAINRFNELWDDDGKDSKSLEYGAGHRYAIFSDLHMGDGSGSDNFRQNEQTLVRALKHYKGLNYAIILLGDTEEFHQAMLGKIYKRYTSDDDAKPSVYDTLKGFAEGRVHRVFGNHDIEWSLRDPLNSHLERPAVEAIILKKGNSKDILITHGHQSMASYEKDLHIVRVGTTFYRELEKIFRFRSNAALDEKPSGNDLIYAEWTRQTGKILICGHTHCPILAKHFIDHRWVINKYNEYDRELKEISRADNPDEREVERLKKRKKWLFEKTITYQTQLNMGKRLTKSPHKKLTTHYFNTGGGLLNDMVTNIEIDEDTIRLVYWFNKEERNQPEELFPGLSLSISDLLAQGV